MASPRERELVDHVRPRRGARDQRGGHAGRTRTNIQGEGSVDGSPRQFKRSSSCRTSSAPRPRPADPREPGDSRRRCATCASATRTATRTSRCRSSQAYLQGADAVPARFKVVDAPPTANPGLAGAPPARLGHRPLGAAVDGGRARARLARVQAITRPSRRSRTPTRNVRGRRREGADKPVEKPPSATATITRNLFGGREWPGMTRRRAGPRRPAPAPLTRLGRLGRARRPAAPGHWLDAVRDPAAARARLPDGVPDPGRAGAGAARAARAPAARRLPRRRRGRSSARAARGFWELPSLFWLGAGDGALARRRLGGRRAVGGGAGRLRERASCSRCSARCRSRSATSGRPSTASAGSSSSSRPGSSASSSCRCSTGGRFRAGRRRRAVIWLLRWLAVRIMWGAGLIKLRGDSCWRDLTCLDFHFETQPVPSPLTPLLPRAAAAGRTRSACSSITSSSWARRCSIFGPPSRAATSRGALMVALQLILIASGNLAFLNWLTLVPILACFDDGALAAAAARARWWRARRRRASAAAPSRAQGLTSRSLGARRSPRSAWPPSLNLLSGTQVMNTLVHAAAARQHLRRVRQRRARARAAGVRRDDRRDVTPETRWLRLRSRSASRAIRRAGPAG